MVTKEQVRAAALDFLKAVAERAKAQLGPRPERVQRSQWMVRTGPSSQESREFEQKVFGWGAFEKIFQIIKLLDTGFPERQRLEDILLESGIKTEEMLYGYLNPLVNHWLELPDPVAFEKTAISKVLDEFVDAVVDGRIVTKSRVAFDRFDLASGRVDLEKGISIRPIAEDELWKLGDTDSLEYEYRYRFPLGMPSEEWKILDVEIQTSRGEPYLPRFRGTEITHKAVLVALRLASPGSFQITGLDSETRYGVRVYQGLPRASVLEGDSYVLDAERAQHLTKSWPRMRQIMESEGHYLRLPAQRLFDGGTRERPEDAVIDYAIGLEALLIGDIRDELRYRFALRGAAILTWDEGNKREWFDKLQEFYDVRSSIVHGARKPVDQNRLNNARSVGENALRDIWWWHFKKEASALKEVTKEMDERILK